MQIMKALQTNWVFEFYSTTVQDWCMYACMKFAKIWANIIILQES